ncbi:hypothetical protein GCM10010220_65400 [Streptomyces parvulus]|uniref:Uncharacterized protein n=1 Tax=Streptomyces parvulus TaxID=146923 RepID=A0A191VAM9_9ACTN|nr:hypothetical protein Spa2297_33040 [Streptomyces parvulus]GGS03916.1 hypothetical protein GCM10010220_65400 [Streptomyces parvulus]
MRAGGVDREEGGEPRDTAVRAEGGDRDAASQFPRQPEVRPQRGGHEFSRGAVGGLRAGAGHRQRLGPGPGGDLRAWRVRYRVGVRHGCLLGVWPFSLQVLPGCSRNVCGGGATRPRPSMHGTRHTALTRA